MGSSRLAWYHLRSSKIIWTHLGSFGITWGHLGAPWVSVGSFGGHFRLIWMSFGVILRHSGLFFDNLSVLFVGGVSCLFFWKKFWDFCWFVIPVGLQKHGYFMRRIANSLKSRFSFQEVFRFSFVKISCWDIPQQITKAHFCSGQLSFRRPRPNALLLFVERFLNKNKKSRVTNVKSAEKCKMYIHSFRIHEICFVERFLNKSLNK